MGNLSWVHSFEEYAEKILEKYEVPGAAIGVAKDGEILYERGFGFRNVKEQLEVTNDTIFGVASITKSFTGVAIMQLQEEGKLSVHDKVLTYLPELTLSEKEHTEKVTIHHLLTHSAGLPPLPTLYYAMKKSMLTDPFLSEKEIARLQEHPSIETYDEMMKFISKLKIDLLGEPGTQFSYSNDSYALLGAIIERVSGISYEEYVTKNILKRAGMNNSTFHMKDVLNSPKATSIYATREKDGEKEVYDCNTWWDSAAMCAGGFLRSTLEDMLRYTEIFRNSGIVDGVKILTIESVQEMTHPHMKFQENKYYGYGLMITPNYQGGTLIEHGGSLKGVSSNFGVIPEKGLASVVLINLVGVPAFKLMVAAFNAVQNIAPETQIVNFNNYEIDPNELDQYTATFRSGEGAEMNVSRVDNVLQFTSEGKTYPMRPVGEHLFTVEMNESETPIKFLFREGKMYGLFLGVRQILKVDSHAKKILHHGG